MADQARQLVESIPPALLKEVPAMSPPPGETSNLINPHSTGPAFSAAASVLTCLVVLAYAVRVYTKAFILRKASWDDCEIRALVKEKLVLTLRC